MSAPDTNRQDARATPLADLSAQEVVMLGHCLRMVPGNAVLTGESAAQLGAGGLAFFSDIEAFKTLWNKVAEAVRERDDIEPYRSKQSKRTRAKRANQKGSR